MHALMQNILHQVILQGERPAQQWYVWAVLDLLRIQSRHDSCQHGTEYSERHKAFKNFNKLGHGVDILILQYVISAEKTGLQSDC